MANDFIVGIGGSTTDVSVGNTATSNTFIGKLVGNAESADKVNHSLTIGDKIFDGSTDIEISKISITNGGTGATTAEEARTNLGITPANIGALALTGGTLTGALTLSADTNYPVNAVRANSVGLRVRNTSANKTAALEVTSSSTGIYIGHVGKWLINHDGSKVNIMGNQYHQIYYGTGTPSTSLGVDGDVYIKYNA